MRPCLLWTGATDGKGYGVKWVPAGGGRRTGAHRWAYEQVHGPVPGGLVIDHLCKTPLCVEVTHLEAVPQRENVRRGSTLWALMERTGRCERGHDLTIPNSRTPQGRCRECWNTYMREYKKRC